MTKTIETAVSHSKFEDDALGREVSVEMHYEITEQDGENYPRCVSVKLLKIIEDGVEESNIPLFRVRDFEENCAAAVAKERGIVTKKADEYGFDGI